MTFKVIHRYVYEQTLNEKLYKTKSKTISEIIKDLGYFSDFAGVGFISSDNKFSHVDRRLWDCIRPKTGTFLITQAPAGDSFKKIAFAVISIAALSMGQPWLAASMGGGFAATVAAGAIVGVGLSFLSGALFPVESPDNSANQGQASSPTLNISGTSNQVRAGSPVPYHIGTNRYIPPLAAQPVKEANGKDVYLNQVFMVGYAPVIISDLRISDTPIENFNDVQIQINDGYTNHNPITIIKGDVSNQSGLSIKLLEGQSQTLRGGDFSEKASMIFALNSGLVNISDKGKYQNRSIEIKVEYKKIGGSTWINAKPSSIQALTFRAVRTFAGTEIVYSGDDNSNTYDRYLTEYFIDLNSVPATMDNGEIFSVSGAGSNSGIYTAQEINGNTIKVGSAQSAMSGKTVSNGSYSSASITFEAENQGAIRFSDSTVEATYRTVDIPFLEKGQYDFRVVRLTADSTSTRIRDEITLVGLKTTQLTAGDNTAINPFPAGFAYIGIRIKASDQLSGNISQLSCKVQSVPETYSPATSSYSRTPDQSGNPAWEYLTLLRSDAAKKKTNNSSIDLDQFVAWAARCNTAVNAKPRHRINHVVDYSSRQDTIMSKIASIGRAAKSEVDGVKTVIFDVSGRPAVQKFSNSNSFGFSASKVFTKKPDAFNCSFVNPAKDWTVDNIKIKRDDSRTETSADIVEDLDCTGITDPDELYRFAKFAHAQIELRPEIYTLSTGIESLFTTKGDVVVVSHDKIQGAVTSSRVSSINGNDIILISDIETNQSDSYFVSFRHSQSAQNSNIYPVSITGNVVTLSATAASADVLPGDLVLIGTAAESIDRKYIIKEIENGEDLNATLTLVDYADPQIFESENGAIVDYNPGYYKPAINTFSRPLPPTILEIITDERALLVNADGSFSARAAIEVLSNDSDDAVSPEFIEISYRPAGSDSYYKTETYPANQSLIYANDVFEGSAYDIRLRYISVQNITSVFTLQNFVSITGKTTPPADVQGLSIENNSGSVLLEWPANSDIDLAGYIVKFTSSLTSPTWGSSSAVSGRLSKSSTQVILPSRVGSYLIKAVDAGGRESINAAIATNNIQSIVGFNVVKTLIEDDQFAGQKTNCILENSSIILSKVNGNLNPIGVYNFADSVDLGGIFDSRLSVEMIAGGIDYASVISSWETLSSVDFLNNADPDKWSVKIELRKSDQSPSAGSWSDWHELKIGDIRARSYQFRAVLSSLDGFVTPAITKLRVVVDMPDRVEGGDDINCPSSGATITYENGAFNETPAVVINGESLSTGDYHRVTAKNEQQFNVNFYNSTGAGISKTFDYVASGYGFKQ